MLCEYDCCCCCCCCCCCWEDGSSITGELWAEYAAGVDAACECG